MKKKNLVFHKILKMLILIVFSACIVGFRLPDNTLERINKPVYIVTDESDYFRLITISTNPKNNIPILFYSDQKSTTKLDNFQKYYQGTSTYLSSQQIDELILNQYSNPSEVVVCDETRKSMLFASLISSALQIPLFVEFVPSDVLGNQNLSSIIAVGEVKLDTGIKTENLDSFEKAQDYYNRLVDKTDTAVVISDPEVYSIGAQSAAYHRAKVFFNIDDGKNSKTDYLIWVTLSGNLGQPNFLKLYASDSVNNVNGLYSQNIGVITGFTVEDMSFLLARTFAYHDMQGDWKNNFVVASVFSSLPSSISNENGRKLQSLGAADLNAKTFEQAVSSANYVFAFAHGSVSGLRFDDGGWPAKDRDLSLPPLLFVAEACSTMDFNDLEMDQSIALKLISSGAVAFLGSMEVGGVSVIGNLPYSNSTDQIPLGELVRMQNSILMDFATDKSRVILIGDPSFFQTTGQQPAIASISPNNTNGFAFEIKNTGPNADIFVKLQSKKAIIRAIATLENGRKILYFRGANYFARTMGVISNNSDQTILFTWPGGDGTIVFFDNTTLPMVLMNYFGDSLQGVRTLLLDLVTISKYPWGYTAVVFVVLLLSFKRLMLKKNKLLLYLSGSFVFSMLVSLVYFEISYTIRIPVTLALFMWSFLSLCFFDTNENNTKKLIYSILLFLIPFLYGLFIALGMGAASKTSVIVLKGVILLGVLFFALQLLLHKIPIKVKN